MLPAFGRHSVIRVIFCRSILLVDFVLIGKQGVKSSNYARKCKEMQGSKLNRYPLAQQESSTCSVAKDFYWTSMIWDWDGLGFSQSSFSSASSSGIPEAIAQVLPQLELQISSKPKQRKAMDNKQKPTEPSLMHKSNARMPADYILVSVGCCKCGGFTPRISYLR